jgi:MYXO-CTERM domain-containing protein
MRHYILAILAAFALISGMARAGTIIDPSLSAGAVPTTAGTGLNGSYYDFSSSIGTLSSLAQTNQLISTMGAATATFTTTAVCFPDCGGTSVSDSGSLSTLLNGNVSNFAYTTPGVTTTSLDHGAMIVSGYIAITHAGSYTFYLGSDDGSQLLIGGQSVINNDGLHSFNTSTGTATFAAAGLYSISAEYFENTGVTGFDLYGVDNSNGQCITGRAANCAPGTAQSSILYGSVPTAAPEPGSLAILAAGLLGLAGAARWRRRIG